MGETNSRLQRLRHKLSPIQRMKLTLASARRFACGSRWLMPRGPA